MKRLGKIGLGKIGLMTIALSLMAGSAGAAVENLVAKEFTKVMPDGVAIAMWGFARASDTSCPSTSIVEGPSAPGPFIIVPHFDDVLEINLCNELDEPVSVVIPGQAMPKNGVAGTLLSPVYHTAGKFAGRVRSFTQEAAASGGTQSYTWDAYKHGTYMYESGSHPQVQIQMGLYGGMKKDFGAWRLAYDGNAHQLGGFFYDHEAILFYSEIDRALHDAVGAGTYDPEGDPALVMTSIADYHADYGLINGQAFPAVAPIVIGTSGDTLLRFYSASPDDRTPVMQGLYAKHIAQDGKLYPYFSEQYSLRLPAGSTRDVMLTVDCMQAGTPGRHVLYDARMKLTNAGSASAGGMRINLQLCDPPADADLDGLPDDQDNCTNTSNSDQRDTDGDGYGNVCDADFNNDGTVNFSDLGIMRDRFYDSDPDADLDGSGIVNYGDLGIMRSQFFQTPGPSALGD
ncbi:MAG: thrombospondin type 3 repeat-containing protein [Gammaproteobacteria bacterium]|nr:thrombospondin type 3 repeat-containing protein [Gammaproteobacteria bacterium]